MTENLLDTDDVLTPLSLPANRPVVTSSRVAELAVAQGGMLHVVGAEGSATALVARALAREHARRILYLVPDSDTARRAAADLAQLGRALPLEKPAAASAPPPEPLLLLGSETTPYAQVHPDRRAAMTRASALFRLASALPWQMAVTTAACLVRRVVPPELITAGSTSVARGVALDLSEVSRRLSASGYLRVPLVEDPGSYAVRGGLLDVWPPDAPLPARIELDGDSVSTVRAFDPEAQRARDELDELWLVPAREYILTAEASQRARDVIRSLCDAINVPSTKARQLSGNIATGKAFFGADGYLPAFSELVPLLSYLGPDVVVVIERAADVLTRVRDELHRGRQGEAERLDTPHFPWSSLYVSEAELARALEPRVVVATHRVGIAGKASASGLDQLEAVPPDAPTLAIRDHADLGRAVKLARTAHGKHGALAPLLRRIEAWLDHRLCIVVTARANNQARRIATLLSHREIPVRVDATVSLERDEPTPPAVSMPPDGREPGLWVTTGPLARGAIAPAEGLVLLTEEEIFGQRAHQREHRGRSARSMLEDLRALSPGDVVVHRQHGKGRYLGLQRKLIGEVSVELLVVEYAASDKLFVPVYRLDQIQKYSGGETSPRLDRLGGSGFAKTKAKVQRRVRQMADELLRLYAERASMTKAPLPPPDDEYAAFEASFPYEETRDQAIAIQDVMRDLSSDQVMDRLVCGDVGFGKTEVALRAAFRNALSGRQTALLCPTTVLAQQHLLTFRARLENYPITVSALSRFQSKREQQTVLRGLKMGAVDIVIGTHRLLSKDVHFKRLGLLVIDEEQRFGVSHKERIKQLRSKVDALALTATPIPRTLQMAVGGLRDMSLIATPPVDRRATRTLTSRFDENLLREAIRRELERGGQVFYVYNRIEQIHERAARVQTIVPDARVAVVHGRLDEAVLEQSMLDFVDGEYDILVTTAIIESGLDIPRANTIIIDRADLFGLSQLYQLRGRVGRASERAYCYLLVPPPSKLTDDARSRIEALERFTELGSGFHIATMDLELRGAGNLLGAEQSGFAASVGFEMYCRMLEEATRELRGEPVPQEVDPELSFDVEALLPEEYIEDVGVRLSLYKRLASAADDGEVAELASEMEDRFGAAPAEARRLVEVMEIKTELRRLKALGMEATARSANLHLRDDTPLDPAKIGRLIAERRAVYRLTPAGRLTRRAEAGVAYADGLALANRMLSELADCLSHPMS